MHQPAPAVFQALVDPTRRRILELLAGREHRVQELVGHFDVSFAAISVHLRTLREARLVARRREGRNQMYRLRPERLKQVHDWTAIYRKGWRGRFQRLHSLVEEEA